MINSAVSPSSLPSRLSPKSYTSNPYLNQFSALSPDLADGHLDDSERDEIFPRSKSRKVYTRSTLLKIAKQCEKRGWEKPQGMGGLDSWFGYGLTRPCRADDRPASPSKAFHHSQMEDPAIASIGPPTGSRRSGPGFGEGFGFGGGIGGGKPISKGGRNVGWVPFQDSQLKSGYAGTTWIIMVYRWILAGMVTPKWAASRSRCPRRGTWPVTPDLSTDRRIEDERMTRNGDEVGATANSADYRQTTYRPTK
jgi:hypothetical protein